MPVPSLVAALVAILYFRRPSNFSASSENDIPFYFILKNSLFLLKSEFLKEAHTDIKAYFSALWMTLNAQTALKSTCEILEGYFDERPLVISLTTCLHWRFHSILDNGHLDGKINTEYQKGEYKFTAY